MAERRRYRDLCGVSGIPALHLGVIRNRRIKAEGEFRKAAGNLYRDAFCRERSMRCLLGAHGTGKTLMACWLSHCFIEKGRPARYTTAFDMLETLNEGFGRGSGITRKQALVRFTGPDLLVIDNLERRRSTEASDNDLEAVIDSRYAAARHTVLISNQKPKVFEEHMGQTIVRRIVEIGGVILCDWSPYSGGGEDT